jgi:hypothetical protein
MLRIVWKVSTTTTIVSGFGDRLGIDQWSLPWLRTARVVSTTKLIRLLLLGLEPNSFHNKTNRVGESHLGMNPESSFQTGKAVNQ